MKYQVLVDSSYYRGITPPWWAVAQCGGLGGPTGGGIGETRDLAIEAALNSLRVILIREERAAKYSSDAILGAEYTIET